MSIVTYEGYFEYQGNEYYILDDVCYCNGDVIYHSDYAYIRNHYEHYNLTVCPNSDEDIVVDTVLGYYLTYYNEYGIRLYETTSKKQRWVSSLPDNLKLYRTLNDAKRTIAARHRYNNVRYYINKLRR